MVALKVICVYVISEGNKSTPAVMQCNVMYWRCEKHAYKTHPVFAYREGNLLRKFIFEKEDCFLTIADQVAEADWRGK